MEFVTIGNVKIYVCKKCFEFFDTFQSSHKCSKLDRDTFYHLYAKLVNENRELKEKLAKITARRAYEYGKNKGYIHVVDTLLDRDRNIVISLSGDNLLQLIQQAVIELHDEITYIDPE